MAEHVYRLAFFPGITRETIDRFIDDLVAELESRGISAGGTYNRNGANLAFSDESAGAGNVRTIDRIIMAVNDRYHCVRGWRMEDVHLEGL